MLDVEFVQLLQDMIGDLTSAPEPIVIKLFSQDPALLQTWAPQVGEAIKKVAGVVDVLDGIENTISGPATMFKVDPAMAARAGFTPQEIELDASAIMQGEPAPTPVVRQRPRVHDPRALSRSRRAQSVDAIKNTLLVSAHGQDRHARHRWRRSRRSRARPRCGARICSATSRSRRGSKASISARAWRRCSGRSRTCTCRRRSAWSTAAPTRSSSSRSSDLLIVLVLAVLLVFTVLLFEFGGFAAPIAVIASALLSTVGVFLALLDHAARRSTSRRSWG